MQWATEKGEKDNDQQIMSNTNPTKW